MKERLFYFYNRKNGWLGRTLVPDFFLILQPAPRDHNELCACSWWSAPLRPEGYRYLALTYVCWVSFIDRF